MQKEWIIIRGKYRNRREMRDERLLELPIFALFYDSEDIVFSAIHATPKGIESPLRIHNQVDIPVLGSASFLNLEILSIPRSKNIPAANRNQSSI